MNGIPVPEEIIDEYSHFFGNSRSAEHYKFVFDLDLYGSDSIWCRRSVEMEDLSSVKFDKPVGMKTLDHYFIKSSTSKSVKSPLKKYPDKQSHDEILSQDMFDKRDHSSPEKCDTSFEKDVVPCSQLDMSLNGKFNSSNYVRSNTMSSSSDDSKLSKKRKRDSNLSLNNSKRVKKSPSNPSDDSTSYDSDNYNNLKSTKNPIDNHSLDESISTTKSRPIESSNKRYATSSSKSDNVKSCKKSNIVSNQKNNNGSSSNPKDEISSKITSLNATNTASVKMNVQRDVSSTDSDESSSSRNEPAKKSNGVKFNQSTMDSFSNNSTRETVKNTIKSPNKSVTSKLNVTCSSSSSDSDEEVSRRLKSSPDKLNTVSNKKVNISRGSSTSDSDKSGNIVNKPMSGSNKNVIKSNNNASSSSSSDNENLDTSSNKKSVKNTDKISLKGASNDPGKSKIMSLNESVSTKLNNTSSSSSSDGEDESNQRKSLPDKLKTVSNKKETDRKANLSGNSSSSDSDESGKVVNKSMASSDKNVSKSVKNAKKNDSSSSSSDSEINLDTSSNMKSVKNTDKISLKGTSSVPSKHKVSVPGSDNRVSKFEKNAQQNDSSSSSSDSEINLDTSSNIKSGKNTDKIILKETSSVPGKHVISVTGSDKNVTKSVKNAKKNDSSSSSSDSEINLDTSSNMKSGKNTDKINLQGTSSVPGKHKVSVPGSDKSVSKFDKNAEQNDSSSNSSDSEINLDTSSNMKSVKNTDKINLKGTSSVPGKHKISVPGLDKNVTKSVKNAKKNNSSSSSSDSEINRDTSSNMKSVKNAGGISHQSMPSSRKNISKSNKNSKKNNSSSSSSDNENLDTSCNMKSVKNADEINRGKNKDDKDTSSSDSDREAVPKLVSENIRISRDKNDNSSSESDSIVEKDQIISDTKKTVSLKDKNTRKLLDSGVNSLLKNRNLSSGDVSGKFDRSVKDGKSKGCISQDSESDSSSEDERVTDQNAITVFDPRASSSFIENSSKYTLTKGGLSQMVRLKAGDNMKKKDSEGELTMKTNSGGYIGKVRKKSVSTSDSDGSQDRLPQKPGVDPMSTLSKPKDHNGEKFRKIPLPDADLEKKLMKTDVTKLNWLEDIQSNMTMVKASDKLSCPGSICFEDIDSSDEIYTLQCPKQINVESLIGTKISLTGESVFDSRSKSNCSVPCESFAFRMASKINLLLPCRNSNSFKLGGYDVAGSVVISERCEVPVVDMSTFSSTGVESSSEDSGKETKTKYSTPLPPGLKLRHPFYGLDYNKVAVPNFDSVKSRDKRKKKKKKMDRVDEPVDDLVHHLLKEQHQFLTGKFKKPEVPNPLMNVPRSERGVVIGQNMISLVSDDEINVGGRSKKMKKKRKKHDDASETELSLAVDTDEQVESSSFSKKKKKKKDKDMLVEQLIQGKLKKPEVPNPLMDVPQSERGVVIGQNMISLVSDDEVNVGGRSKKMKKKRKKHDDTSETVYAEELVESSSLSKKKKKKKDKDKLVDELIQVNPFEDEVLKHKKKKKKHRDLMD